MANCICDIYVDFATYHTAIETVDDLKLLATFVIVEGHKYKFVIVKKT